MAALEEKVGAVYVECIGENEANISALQMLTNIENKLEELFEMIAKMLQGPNLALACQCASPLSSDRPAPAHQPS